MSFIQADDEDVDFLAVGGGNSKLVNIFTEPHHDNASLKFVAPKQPRKVDNQAAPGVSMSALFTAVVHGYKFDGNKYTLQGKLGAALLGNHNIRSYKLLLYKGKQQPVAISTINSKFVFNIQTNRYASFTDDQQGNWSVMFDSDSILEEFAKQVALAKANSLVEGEAVVISQPMTVGEGAGLELGDTAHILYTGYLLTNFGFGPAFETNQGAPKPFKIKLGKGKYIKGLEDGLVGAKKNSKVLLAIPPSLGFGAQGLPTKVPPDSTLLYEVEVVKVKTEKELRSSFTPSKQPEQTLPSTTAAEKKSHIPSTSVGDEIRKRSSSSPEQPKSDKAQIISRMAKMGMTILPGMSPPTYGLATEEAHLANEASENEEELNVSHPSPQKSRAKSVTAPPVSPTPAPAESAHKNMAVSSTIPMAYAYDPRTFGFSSSTGGNFAATTGSSYAPAMPFSAYPPPMVDSHLPLLLTETRTQNTEIRLMLSKLGDKLDSLFSKVEGGQPSRSTDIVTFKDIERIIDENSKLKMDTMEKSLKLASLTDKDKIPKVVESEELKVLREDKAALVKQVSDLNVQLVQVTSQLEQAHAQMSRIQDPGHSRKVSSLEQQLAESQRITQDLQKQVELLQSSLEHSNKSRESLELTFKEKKLHLQEEMERSKKEMEDTVEGYKKEMEGMRDKLAKMENESVLNNAKLTNEAYIGQVTKDLESQWKVKYDLLKAENDLFKMESQGLIERLKNQMTSIQDEAAYNANLNIELKRLVNAVYRSLQNDIEPNGSYLGVDILQLVLETFRTITLQLLDSYQKNESNIKSSSGPLTPTSESVSKESSAIGGILDLPSVHVGSPNPHPPVLDSSPTQGTDTIPSKLTQEIISQENVLDNSSQNVSPPEEEGEEGAVASKRYMFFDTKEKQWKPQPPPPPLFEDEDDEEEDEEDWLK